MFNLIKMMLAGFAYAIIIAGVMGMSVEAKELNIVQGIDSLVRQVNSPGLTVQQMDALWLKLKELNPDEVLAFKKYWRENQALQGKMSSAEILLSPLGERIDNIISETIQQMYGENATIFNISPMDFFEVERELKSNRELVDLVRSVELSSYSEYATMESEDDCYYDDNWPGWLKSTSNSGKTYKSGGSGRVKNDPDESPCDFVLYIPAEKFKKVTGATVWARCVVNADGGLSASPSRDAVIIGYWRCVACGFSASESYLRKNILFKKD